MIKVRIHSRGRSSVGAGTRSIFVNSTLTLAGSHSELDVAGVSPGDTPRVLDDNVLLLFEDALF
jgi:hypothetical protein